MTAPMRDPRGRTRARVRPALPPLRTLSPGLWKASGAGGVRPAGDGTESVETNPSRPVPSPAATGVRPPPSVTSGGPQIEPKASDGDRSPGGIPWVARGASRLSAPPDGHVVGRGSTRTPVTPLCGSRSAARQEDPQEGAHSLPNRRLSPAIDPAQLRA